MKSAFASVLCSLALGCSTTPSERLPHSALATNAECAAFASALPMEPLGRLDRLAELSEKRCHREVIALGQWLREFYRDREYSISREAISIFVPEDTLSEYVLESYERVYLSLLVASSYLELDDRDAASVELRRAYSESKARIYNHGEDPVNLFLAASLWEKLEQPDEARPFWQKLSESFPSGHSAREAALARLSEIDGKIKPAAPLRIVRVGRFPEITWEMSFLRQGSGYYHVTPKVFPPGSCHSPTGARVDVMPWVAKIEKRYSSDYHPLLSFKSWVRLPIGVAYGLTTFTAGLGVSVGGCVADAYAELDGYLCEASLKGGGYLIGKSGDLIDYTVRPDLRHWRRLPAAFVVTRQADIADEPCFTELDLPSRLLYFEH